jgi:heat-inducible transcriptional repressor
MSDVRINDRAENLLNVLIRRYVSDGQPVGSRTLSRETALDLSPATIRNVMADLEDMGFVSSPHTSAGRVPTQRGYRFFVDSIMKVNPIENTALNEIREHLDVGSSREAVIGNASQLLSQLTHFAGIVRLSKSKQGRLKEVEFLKLSGNRLLAILVTENADVENRVLSLDRTYTEKELIEASNYFNQLYSGKTLDQVRAALVGDMQRDNKEADRIMNDAVGIARELFAEDTAEDDDVLVSGETNLIGLPEFNEMNKLRGIFDTFKTKHDLLDLLDRSINGDGINIFIGEESGYRALTDCSVVTAPYRMDEQNVGVIGVIGPTRMAYESIIPVVDVTAKLLSNALSHQDL